MTRWLFLGITLIFLGGGCLRSPSPASILPPTPTPIPAGNFTFDSNRIASETRAIEVKIFGFTPKGVPVEQSSVLLTDPAVVQEMVRILLTAASGDCTTTRPTLEPQPPYGVDLILYNRSDIIPSQAASASAMLASVDYYAPNYIGLWRPGDEIGEPIYEFCPVASLLKELLQRELTSRGIPFK